MRMTSQDRAKVVICRTELAAARAGIPPNRTNRPPPKKTRECSDLLRFADARPDSQETAADARGPFAPLFAPQGSNPAIPAFIMMIIMISLVHSVYCNIIMLTNNFEPTTLDMPMRGNATDFMRGRNPLSPLLVGKKSDR